MQFCLVLNNTFEPLMVIQAKKAIKLYFKEKADILKVNELMAFSSVNQVIPMPSVLRLRRYVKFRRKPIQLSRKNVLIRDKATCQYCGKTFTNMTVDHIFPLSKGGMNVWNNVVCCCRKCNRIKANKTLEQVGFILNKQPKEPSPFIFFRSKYLVVRPDWEEYLFV